MCNDISGIEWKRFDFLAALPYSFARLSGSFHLTRTLIHLILLPAIGIASMAQAQTTNAGNNLDRLSEAVKAINENQLPHAEELLNSVLATSRNDADALNLLGVIRAKQDRVADAERLFRRALSVLPSHIGAHINLAELLLAHNRPEEAMPILISAHKLAPARPEINLNLATLYIEKGNSAQAYDHLRLVPREAFNDEYFLLMLRSLVGLNREQEVRELVPQFQQSNSQNAETQAEFATLLVKAGFHDEALRILNKALQTSRSFPVVYALGIVKLSVKDYREAEEYLNSALTLKPDDVATLRALARVARVTGNFEKALSHLIKARRTAPDSAGVLYDFGVTALQMGLILDALPVFEQLQRDYPREPTYLYALAAAHWTKGDLAETTRLMNTYVALQPRAPLGWYLLGAALLRQEKPSEAKVAIERSLSLKVDADSEYLLGVIFEKAGDGVAATDRFRKVVQLRPDHAAGHAALGTAYREAGNYAEARLELERAVELDANDLRANYQLGLVYAKLGEKEAAQKMFDRADELRKRHREQETVILKLIDEPSPQP
jgi:tetratricopeptide (TPR) repeat protein